MESLVSIDRILGGDNTELLPIRRVAMYHKRCENFDICIGLYKHALMISLQRHCGDEVTEHLRDLTDMFYDMITKSVPPRQEVLVEILEVTYLKYPK